MELRHLQYFVAVAEELSFTRASRQLHVVQSGVSSAIQSLERELGVALFDRTRQRVVLTDVGEVLLPEARATLAAAQAARDAVDQASGGLRGTLTVGTMLSTGSVDVPMLLGRFRMSHPDVAIRLRLASGGSADLAREVIAGRLDLALVSLPGPAPAGLAVRPVADEPLVLMCHPDHPLAGESGVTLARLSHETFVDFPPGWGNRTVVDRAFAAEGIERHVPFEAADFVTAAGMVRHALGIAFVPTSTAEAYPDLRGIRLSSPDLIWTISVAVPAGRRTSAAARALVTELTGGSGAKRVDRTKR